MATTPIYGWPYQSLSDPPDGAALGEDLALAIEADVVRVDTHRAPEIFTASGTWNDPGDGWKAIVVECWGPGGGGGGSGLSSSGSAAIGGPGGGGEYARSVVTPGAVGASETVTVGTGGAGGDGTGTAGSAGTSATSFGAHAVANPGQGGAGDLPSSNATETDGGRGGTGGTGQLLIPGGDGSNAFTVAGQFAFTGLGGVPAFGTAATPLVSGLGRSPGEPGNVPGNGGTGGFNRDGVVGSRGGGAGGNGLVIVTYTY